MLAGPHQLSINFEPASIHDERDAMSKTKLSSKPF